MNSGGKLVSLELVCIIVNFGMATRIAKIAKKFGISGDTILLGRGTDDNAICNYIGISDLRKEILYLVAERESAYQALEKISTDFKFHRPNHGIAFTTSICEVTGMSGCQCVRMISERDEGKEMYQIITIIVDKGKAEDVVEAASKAGSKGATIVNGRGSGIHETTRLFAMEIEPEKEIVMILAATDLTEKIITAIRQDLKIDEPGKGIIYVQNVNKTYGIVK